MIQAKIKCDNMTREVCNNFTDPLEAIREGLQNSVDAKSKHIYIDISLEETDSGMSVKVVIEDDGVGIPPEHISDFFDLAQSTKVYGDTIGYKGVGTATYYNSERVKVETYIKGKKYVSIADKPYTSLFNQQMVHYSNPELVKNPEAKFSGVRVTIFGYMKNAGDSHIDLYSHPSVRDYILSKTVFASIKGQFEELQDMPNIYLKTYDSEDENLQKEFLYHIKDGYEEIGFGHVFPNEEVITLQSLKRIAKEHSSDKWDDFYCKRIFAGDVYIDGLVKPVQILIWIEGDQCKKSYNRMIRDGSRARCHMSKIMYKVQDRYGFWACKDSIPIQKVNDWIVGKGSYTQFHAFVNYDDFSLTANRSSINNTNPDVISKIKDKLNEILADTNIKGELKKIKGIHQEAKNERNVANENLELAKRLRQCKARKSVLLGNTRYYEPRCEGEVALLFMGILQNYPALFPYEILDYNTHKGIDMLIRENPDLPLANDNTVGYLELKYSLEKDRINHSFYKLRFICIYDNKEIIPGKILVDLSGKKLKLQKVGNSLVFADYLGEVGHSIRLLVLKDFLASQGNAMG